MQRKIKEHTCEQPNANSTDNEQGVTPQAKAKRLHIIIVVQGKIAFQLLRSALAAHLRGVAVADPELRTLE